MRINYTSPEGRTYELTGMQPEELAPIERMLDPDFDMFGGPTKLVVHHAEGNIETYAPRPPDPERYTVEYRTPRYGERYFEWLGGTVGTRMVDQRIDVNYGPLIGKRAVIVEEL